MRADNGRDRARADEAPASEERAPLTVGSALRRARNARRLSLEQVAGELRMEPPLLQALEEDRFEALGARVFVKGYLKHYGHRLGLDTERLLTMYYEQVGSQEPPMVPRRSIDMDETPALNGRVIAAAVVLVLAAAGVWWLSTGDGAQTRSLDERSADLPAALDAPVAGAPVSDVPSAPVAAQETAGLEQTAGVERTGGNDGGSPPPSDAALDEARGVSPAQADTAPPAPAADRPVIDPPADEVVASRADGDEARLAAGAAAEAAQPSPARGNLVEIEMTMSDDCWTEVTDAGGERLYYGLAQAGESLRLEGEGPVSFLFGNADAVRLSIGGEPYPVPMQGRQGNRARFTVSRTRAPLD